MKDKIIQLAKGNYESKKPLIELSETAIEIKTAAGSNWKGSLTLTSRNQEPILGFADSTKPYLQLVQQDFQGEVCTLDYEFRGQFEPSGKEYEGVIHLLTNAGEFHVPYHIVTTEPMAATLTGIGNRLEDFAALCETSWIEGCKLFVSPQFELVYLTDEKKKLLYRMLMQSASKEQALEEFLLAEKLKEAVCLSLKQKELVIHADALTMEYTIEVEKNTYGYVGALVSTDAAFLELTETYFFSEDFQDNQKKLTVFGKENLQRENFGNGHLTIQNGGQILSIPVIYREGSGEEKDLTEYLLTKELLAGIWQEYFQFRTKKQEIATYIRHTKQHLKDLRTMNQDSFLYRLLEIHMYILDGQVVHVVQGLDSIAAEFNRLKEDMLAYCYYYYLKALYYKSDEAIEHAVELIRNAWYMEPESCYYYVMLLLLDKELAIDPEQQLSDMLALYEAGCQSPMLYLELCDFYNGNPRLLKKAGPAEAAAFGWGMRQNFLSREVMEELVALLIREKFFDAANYRMMKRVYQKFPKKEYLTILCAMLIKGHKAGKEYLRYYQNGVTESIKLIGLNEAYIKSLDYTKYEELPRNVLLYFTYSDSLNEEELSYLYGNLIHNEEKYADILPIYNSKIEEFLIKQASKGLMNERLAYLYQNRLPFMLENERMLVCLANIIFKRRVSCSWPGIRGIVAAHAEDQQTGYAPFVNGVAYIDVFTEQSYLMLQDERDRRYLVSVPFEEKAVLEEQTYWDMAYEYNQQDRRILLKLGAYILQHGQMDARAVSVAKRVRALPEIAEYMQNQMLYLLICHYDRAFEKETMLAYLLEANLLDYSYQQRNRLVEYLIQYHQYGFAKTAVLAFGFGDVEAKYLQKLADYLIQEGKEKEKLVLDLSMEAYRNGCYDADTLAYLNQNYAGSLEDMKNLYLCAKELGVKSKELKENYLMISLFTEEMREEVLEIFDAYWQERPSRQIVEAFLKFYARELFQKEQEAPENFIQHLYEEAAAGRLADDGSKAAFLSFLLKREEPMEGMELAVIRSMLYDFIKQGRVLPYFQEFGQWMKLPEDVMIKNYLSYRAEPGQTVAICYSMDKKQTARERYQRMPMQEVLPGYYVASFVIFQDEKLRYSILMEQDGRSQAVKEGEIEQDSCARKGAENQFDILNLILLSRQMKEEDTMYQLSEEYIRRREVAYGQLHLR